MTKGKGKLSLIIGILGVLIVLACSVFFGLGNYNQVQAYGCAGCGRDNGTHRPDCPAVGGGSLTYRLSANEKRSTNATNQEKKFDFYAIKGRQYIVETFGSTDTMLSVGQWGLPTLMDDDSGDNRNAKIEFTGNNGLVSIYLKSYSGSGSTMLQIRNQQVVMYGFRYPGNDINTVSDLDKPRSDLMTAFHVEQYTDAISHDPNHILSNDERDLKRINSEVVFYAGHGREGMVAFPYNKRLYAGNLPNVKDVKIAVWASCLSSIKDSSGKSMASASVSQGAKSSLGWNVSGNDESYRLFTNSLFDSLAKGKSLAEAVIISDNAIPWSMDGIHDYKIEGNGNVKLMLSTVSQQSYCASGEQEATTNEVNKVEMQRRFANTNKYQIVQLNERTKRIYRTYNGLITNDYYDIIQNDGTETVNHSGIYFDNKSIKPMLTKFKKASQMTCGKLFLDNSETKSNSDKFCEIKTHTVYYANKDIATPIEITYSTYESAEGYYYQKVDCVNLSTGDKVNYADICEVKL